MAQFEPWAMTVPSVQIRPIQPPIDNAYDCNVGSTESAAPVAADRIKCFIVQSPDVLLLKQKTTKFLVVRRLRTIQ